MTSARIYLDIKLICIFLVWLNGPLFSQPEKLILVDALVFDGQRMQKDWVVVCEEGTISYAGPKDAFQGDLKNAHSLEGHTVLPGMIEGHSHLLLHPYNETSWNDQVLKESYTERALRGANHALKTLQAGFTTTRDLGSEGAGYVDVMLKKSIEKGIVPGPRILAAGRAIVSTGSYGPKGFAPHVTVPLGAGEADADNMVKVVRNQIGHGIDLVKVYADYRWGPFGQAAPTFSEAEIRLIVETAASSGRHVVAHASTAEGMRRATLAGVRTIEHGDGGTPEVFRLMRDRGVALCPTLAAGDAIMQYRGWRKGVEAEPPRILQKRRSFKAALDAEVTICAGGDVGVFSHGDNVRELEIMVDYGMSSIDVLRSVTSINAEVFELDKLGYLREGYIADLIIVKGNPVEEISNLRNVVQVVQSGHLVAGTR